MSQLKQKRLLVSIHDVGPGFASEIEQLVDRLSARLGGNRFAMLVVPDHWGRHPLAGNAVFACRLRRWSDAGIEMFVHGWFHRDTAAHTGLNARGDSFAFGNPLRMFSTREYVRQEPFSIRLSLVFEH